MEGRRNKMTYSLYYNQLQMNKMSGEEDEIECHFPSFCSAIACFS